MCECLRLCVCVCECVNVHLCLSVYVCVYECVCECACIFLIIIKCISLWQPYRVKSTIKTLQRQKQFIKIY